MKPDAMWETLAFLFVRSAPFYAKRFKMLCGSPFVLIPVCLEFCLDSWRVRLLEVGREDNIRWGGGVNDHRAVHRGAGTSRQGKREKTHLQVLIMSLASHPLGRTGDDL